MALTGMSDDFDLDDHGILRDSFASDFNVDDDGILHDDLELFKHAVNTAGHGTDSGFGGDKQSSSSTLQHLHASFDEDLAPIGDESVNISDFEASRDDLDSIEGGDVDGSDKRKSRGYRTGPKELDTPGSTLERPLGASTDFGANVPRKSRGRAPRQSEEDQELFSKEYYQQLRELGVLVDGADFSREEEESQNEFEVLESHLSREQIDYDDDHDNRDLIGEYLQDEYEREQAEHEVEGGEREGRAGEKGEKGQQYALDSRASSAPTISGRSFPEISPEDADMIYGESQSQQTGDDDEIFLINRHLLQGSSRIHAEKLPAESPGPGSRPSSRGSRPQTPQTSDGQRRHGSRLPRRSPSPGSQGPSMMQRSRSEANTPHRPRPDSAASQASVASESPRHPRSGRSSPGKSAMSKARSQESFFEQDKVISASKSGGEKIPKRMLPTPTAPETGNQSFRVKSKSKSVSNISQKSAPVKPTHMSISEITRATMDETSGGEGQPAAGADSSQGELSTQLKQESSKRKQATELVQQLQKEYDSLLSKYALAELTIDQFRLGARISLHADSPTPGSAVQSGAPVSPGVGQKPQMLSVAPPVAAQRAAAGHYSPGVEGHSMSTAQVQTSDAHSRSTSRAEKPVAGVHGNLDAGGAGGQFASEDRGSGKKPAGAETVKLSIQTQATSVNDRLDQFHTLLENRQLTLEEQEKAFENIRTDHEKLRRSYLQAKEDYNVLRRSGAAHPSTDFDGNKELEGQLFRLGMKFDEVHEHVDSNVKAQTSRRKPFETSRLAEDQADQDAADEEEGQGADHADGATGDSKENAKFEKRAEHLHQEYRALMDRYRRLKQMAPTPELEKETDNVVRKMKDICTEMPEMFRLPPELQERFDKWKKSERLKIFDRLNNVWEKLQRRDQRRSPLPQGGEEGAVGGAHPGTNSVPPSPKVRGSPLVGDHSISPYIGSGHGSRDSRLDDSLRGSFSGSRSSLTSPRDHNTSTAATGSTPSPLDRNGRGSPSSVDGAAAPRDRDNYDPRIHRPHRHRHDFRDPKLSKRPDRGSYSSLPDSGISDQEGRDRRPDSALAHLPGPGTMKQLTRQRGDNDMDSGFIGSVVSTEGQGPPASPNQGAQPVAPLRLRERPPTDRNQNRSRLDSTASNSTVGSVRREAGGDRRSRHATKPPVATASTSAGVGQHSIDRSYDGELDESTISEQGLQRDVRAKDPVGRLQDRKQQQQHRGRKGDEVSQSSRSNRSLSRSTQEDETLEDVSDGEMTDVSTPRMVEPSEGSTQKTSSSIANRPPTPMRPPTPLRPPTPYHEEGKEEGREVDAADEEETPAKTVRPVNEEVVQNRPQLQQQMPRSPAPLLPHEQNRPQSRGEPTTDLYHTRPRRHSRDDRESVASSISARARHSRRNSETSDRIRGEDHGVGSDIEVGSNATRGSSVNSARLRALQDEIERLKEGVKSAHDKAAERVAPPPQPPAQPPAQPDQQGPEYFDPFDDPYGFMRMPRRRANSFSGRNVREFDEWYWTHPNQRQDDDIPLGYAAADAYNRHYRDKTPEASARQRFRRRHDRRRRGEEDPQGDAVENGQTAAGGEAVGASPPQPSTGGPAPPAHALRRPPITDPQALYNYYVPTRQGTNPAANPYRQRATPLSASQPNLAGTLAGVQPATYPYQQQQQQPPQQSFQPQLPDRRPWYQIRRAQWPASSSGQYYPTYQAQQPVAASHAGAYYYSASYPVAASGAAAPPTSAGGGVMYKTESCPLCGSYGAHIHEEDVDPVHGYAAQDFATRPGQERHGRPRQRSRSAPRGRHYTPERSSSSSRYLVREYGDSASDGSDIELPRSRRRSRSLSRSRGHSETRSSATHSSSRRRGRRYRRRVDMYDSDENVDLNESLVLSEDINRLTRRMIGTVRGELNRHKDRKEFGSSYW